MRRDVERLDRFIGLMDEEGIDIYIVVDEVNIRYLLGGVVDYSLGCLCRDGTTYIVTPEMELERAKEVTWADEVIGFSRLSSSENVVKAENVFEALSKYLGDFGKVGIPFSYISHSNFLRLLKYFGSDRVVDGDRLIRDARMIKSAYELEYICKAAEIIDMGIKFSIDNISVGITEEDVAIEAHRYMRTIGAERVYDDLIVASGVRSALPHGRASDKEIMKGDPVTLDYVSSYNGYYGDETRTVFVGRVGKELRRIYEVVLESLEMAIDHICEGVTCDEIDSMVRNNIERHGYGKYFIHSTGHGIGLEVHEMPRLSMNDKTFLKRNMVVTVEPGIYIPGLGGVRIEDDVLVTSDGCKVLTRTSKEIIFI